jgi:hypothetical protein
MSLMDDLDKYKRTFEFMQALDCYLLVCITRVTEKNYNIHAEMINRIGEKAKQYQIHAHLHNNTHSIGETFTDWENLIPLIDWNHVHMMLDTDMQPRIFMNSDMRTEHIPSWKNTLYRKKRETPLIQPEVDGTFEAHMISICCSESAQGYERWTLRLIANKCVKLGYIDSISHMTVKRVLKKQLKPHLKRCWCIPPKHNAAFVAARYDIYEKNYLKSLLCSYSSQVNFSSVIRRESPFSPFLSTVRPQFPP